MNILGTLVGLSLAEFSALSVVIWSYEKSLPIPESSPPPTDEEIDHVVALALTKSEVKKNETVNFFLAFANLSSPFADFGTSSN